MKKRNLLAAAAFIATAFVSTTTAEEPAFHGYNSWHAGKASATLINRNPEEFDRVTNNHVRYGCKIEIRPGGGSQTPERWYVLGSAGNVDTKLYYQDTDGTWKTLDDDISSSDRNYKAVIHVPQRFTNEAASKNILLQAGYYSSNNKEEYWHHADQYETADPQLTGVPYLEVAPDGTMTVVQH